MFYTQENLVKDFYIQEGNDIISYQKLSEDQKEMFNKEIVKRLVDEIESKSQNLDTKIIDDSKGDLTKLTNYSYIKDSIDLLNNMQTVSNKKIPYFDIISNAHGNIIKFKDDFEKGYRYNKNLIKIFYSQITLALISSISFTIATCVDYIKDPMGNYQAVLNYNANIRNNYPIVEIDALEKFNLAANNGELAQFFEVTISSKIKESVSVITLAGIGTIFYGIFKIAPLIPEILRLLLTKYYYNRIDTADYLRLQASFLEFNINKNKNSVNYNKKAMKKQEEVVKKLNKLADKIDVNEKVNSKKTKNEIERQNKDISNKIKDNSSNDDYIDEIIL